LEKIGLDPAIGTEQPKDAYWRRMKEFFDAPKKSANGQGEASIRYRWGSISTDAKSVVGLFITFMCCSYICAFS
jgi:hypothetical protein